MKQSIRSRHVSDSWKASVVGSTIISSRNDRDKRGKIRKMRAGDLDDDASNVSLLLKLTGRARSCRWKGSGSGGRNEGSPKSNTHHDRRERLFVWDSATREVRLRSGGIAAMLRE